MFMTSIALNESFSPVISNQVISELNMNSVYHTISYLGNNPGQSLPHSCPCLLSTPIEKS